MRTKFWCGITVLASIVAGAGAAGAADLAVKAPPMAAPVYLSDWAGFYIGVNGGGGWASTTFDKFTGLNAKPTGGVVGGHAGYNWQYGSVVGGLELDFDGADLKKTVGTGWAEKTDELASARARVGYVVLPQLLAYGTAGGGWGHTTATSPLGGTYAAVNQFGWVAGAGLEYKVWGPLVARAEYLHYDFSKTTTGAWSPDSFKESVDVVRGGLSYKF